MSLTEMLRHPICPGDTRQQDQQQSSFAAHYVGSPDSLFLDPMQTHNGCPVAPV
jgi:hypothetical protein